MVKLKPQMKTLAAAILIAFPLSLGTSVGTRA